MTKDSQTSARVVGRAEGDVVPFIGMVKAGAADTGGAFEIIDYTGPATPPPHIHRQHDEVFYVLRGRFTFTLGQEVVVADEGSTVLVPRGTRHGFTTDLDARALLITVPASLQGFFEELGAGLAAGHSSEEIRKTLAGRYDSIPAP
jgi:quercetin dioxygenase-like cupin family protein